MLVCDTRIPRGTAFKPDPLALKETDLQSSYDGSGYDRGHNMNAEDNRCDKQGMDESFYFSNMTPQVPQLNRGVWKSLETEVRETAAVADSVKVWMGSVGEIKKVLDNLRELGLTPCRARVACLKAHSKSLVHRDANSSEYMTRIHIPLWTNKKSVHICQGKNLHMPADGGVWILWTNIWHQIRNDSDEDRYHIIMDAYDTKKITKNLMDIYLFLTI
jgi:hypothetical protein